ncbi:phage tail-collar fiber domain-containing protein [Acinetobacter baumannii]
MAALYHSLFTEKGLALLRESIQNGTKLGITHMSFGDGGGMLPTPDATFTHMVNEVYRVALNRLAPSRENPNWLEADGVIPSAVGGFNIREVGLWAGNIMVAYANYPPTYKSSGDQGTAQIKSIRIVLQIDNTANFELKIDASVVMATIQAVEDVKQEIYKNTLNTIDSIESLKLTTVTTNGNNIFLKSYYDGKNLGGGIFSLIIDPTLIANEGTIISTPTQNTYWVRENQSYVTPEMFGAIPNDPNFDNTVALNRAFLTGFDVSGKKDDVYYVKGSLRTKGQKLIGGWKIHSKKTTSRKGIWEQEVTVNNDGLDTSNNIRMMYVSSAWDLSEFLAIKALGYNMIHHYVGMSQMGWDRDGNVFDVLNNAKSAGLKVSLGIEQDPAAKADLSTWVKSVDNYPALWAYSVIDEPVSRGFSVADQDAKIATMRSLTKKTLFTVDWQNNAFEQKYSKNYDMVLVNSYSMKYTTDASTWFQEDLKKFRGDFGVIKSQVGTNVRVIPCVSMFSFTNTANFFSTNVDQIVKSSEYFAKVSNGDYAAFVWDGEADNQITGSVRDTPQFQDLSVRLSKQPRLQFKTDVIKFGGFNDVQTDWGTNEIIKHVLSKDTNSVDQFLGKASYPVVLKNGSVESDRATSFVQASKTVSGIAFKSNQAKLVTNLAATPHLRLVLEAFSPQNIIAGKFKLSTTNDAGYTSSDKFEKTISGNQVIDADIQLNNSDGTLIFELEDSNTNEFYRNFLRGVVILTDW